MKSYIRIKSYLKILSCVLIVFAVSMAIKQGFAMISESPQMIAMFSKWHFSATGVKITGFVTLLSALLILFPKTFVAGNVIMAITIIMIFVFQLIDRNVSGALLELPFVLLNFAIIYLGHPFSKNP